MSLFMRRKIQRSAFRSISRSRGSSCCSTLRGNTLARSDTWTSDRPNGELKVIEPRRRGVIYEIDHVGDKFFIRTNLGRARLPTDERARGKSRCSSNWTEIVPQEPGHYLSHFEAFETFVAVDIEDEDGTRVRAFGFPMAAKFRCRVPLVLASPRVPSTNDNEANLEPGTTVLRFRFSGPLQPECIYDFDVSSGTLTSP